MTITSRAARLAAAALVAALLASASTSATAGASHRGHAATPSAASQPVKHSAHPGHRPPADEAQEYVSLGIAVEHAAREQRSHGRTEGSAGTPGPLTLSPPNPTESGAWWAAAGLVATAFLALTGLAAIGLRRIRNRRRAVTP